MAEWIEVQDENDSVVLRNRDALFVWRKFDAGVNCAEFRNDSSQLSSDMILAAESVAYRRWPGARLYTYVNASEVQSRNPGYCFLMAGWEKCGITESGLLIMEKADGDPGEEIKLPF